MSRRQRNTTLRLPRNIAGEFAFLAEGLDAIETLRSDVTSAALVALGRRLASLQGRVVQRGGEWSVEAPAERLDEVAELLRAFYET